MYSISCTLDGACSEPERWCARDGISLTSMEMRDQLPTSSQEAVGSKNWMTEQHSSHIKIPLPTANYCFMNA
ncbi:hypothetical protein FRX31_022436 [Thalictrum thalictroides]|uniref:Uncharacterized protein n=1 Tax=Thalictrum thalictroides TaxID=46969 RepID=A0A7J6VT88_THATH|nr:hypothetical protein FRX31_022436 [Thalictrum thalictroides]